MIEQQNRQLNKQDYKTLALVVLGGFTPICVTYLMKFTPMAPAYYVLALSVLGFAIGVYLRNEIDETKEIAEHRS